LSNNRCGAFLDQSVNLPGQQIDAGHISGETRAWLADQPAGRFKFTFTPKHGSWLNLIERFFSKLARSVLRHIRVRAPVVHTWIYKLDKAA
jgi:hypothetical protein